MDWIYSPTDPLLETIAGSIIAFVLIILLTRIIGLRSFAKFTVYDFAVTIAVGSIISSVLTSSTSVVQGFIAIGALLGLTYVFSALQKKYKPFDNLISNDPVLLMDGSKMLYDNLKSAKVQEGQVVAKLREANVLNYDQIVAVVLESTGDISVLHRASSNDDHFEERLLQGVVKRK
ncbi:putative membrane protein [Owenweeksia hongkongensis DSM 17368]|uniref:Putative membrane protein n=1 Tax=Owenweeksia hongkongensis (strain DSM 17368 / CIP 108786 / JCM 12287 / NRRL B-23963 / UST20020801) TaxID=926562 RepID=G8R5J6_OWEHD|nr:YetF domain-containing protein [Owenweeksia hongkongensis]AEV33270.1 putative membrane protein [Owenweeksia hongkongensis DSM 17368]